jgi:hypothetical protein
VGVARPHVPQINRPPDLLHLVVRAAPAGGTIEWEEEPTTLRNGLLREERSAGFSLGRRIWGGKRGSLLLAPSSGGLHADHLLFLWREGSTERAVSLHAWEPLSESAAALEEIIHSIPQSALLRLPAGRSSSRSLLFASDPPTHPFDVHVETAASARLTIDIRTWYGQVLHVLWAASMEAWCHQWGTQARCLIPLPILEAQRAGRWTLIVRKRSQAPVTAEVSVAFKPVETTG